MEWTHYWIWITDISHMFHLLDFNWDIVGYWGVNHGTKHSSIPRLWTTVLVYKHIHYWVILCKATVDKYSSTIEKYGISLWFYGCYKYSKPSSMQLWFLNIIVYLYSICWVCIIQNQMIKWWVEQDSQQNPCIWVNDNNSLTWIVRP